MNNTDLEETVLGLLRGLFHAFRRDGVLVLLHVYDDQYMLVSKEKVIKRAIQRAKQRCTFPSAPQITRDMTSILPSRVHVEQGCRGCLLSQACPLRTCC
jgi:hypothetical protein